MCSMKNILLNIKKKCLKKFQASSNTLRLANWQKSHILNL